MPTELRKTYHHTFAACKFARLGRVSLALIVGVVDVVVISVIIGVENIGKE